MKFLWLLIAVLALVAADDSGSPSHSDDDHDDDDVAAGGVQGRTGAGGKQGSSRFFDVGLGGGIGGGIGGGFGGFGGLGGIGAGLGALGGLGGFGGLGGLGGIGGIGGIGAVRPPSDCRYWCRTPQGQAYCCESALEPQSFAGVVKPGFCPPVRPVCPPVRNFLPPAPCSNDGACGGVDKCCFDTCLQQHVCKPPLGFGRR
ncbi:uncharacterized PE-PGRS family protein PE_PGRS54-like [Macrobrachium rosenbergii]|uniref:uncharacterized PE-PGRS family protein PE_PGRS54-like n=1 Tax=Macrobrachium rosenbergii TaxID=79674 RepID=UPI0034D49F50